MELRVLEYFLAVVREGTLSGAAEALHLTQPTLSRQIRELEEQLGVTLFLRGNRQVTLTPEGTLLRRRAEEILSLVSKTQGELLATDEAIVGDVLLGAAETNCLRPLSRVAIALQKEQPGIRFLITGGDSETLRERLDRGLLDFALLMGQPDTERYESLPMQRQDRWGLLARSGTALAGMATVTAADLVGEPLILPAQASGEGALAAWLRGIVPLRTAATYDLTNHAVMLVEEGMGSAVVA